MSLLNFFDKLNKTSLYLLLISVPLLYLPFTQNYLDFPKEILAQILIALSLIGWVGKSSLKGELILRGSKIFYFSLFFLIFSLFISSIFSVSKKSSFLGLSLDYVDSFVNLVLLILLAFLIINSFEEKSDIISLITIFIISGFISGIINLFQIYKIFLLPGQITKTVAFNTVGNPNAFSIFSLCLLPISLLFAFRIKEISKSFFTLFILASLVFFLNILFVNFKTAWGALIVAILFFFILLSKDKKISSTLIFLSMLGLIISIFFYFFSVPLKWFPSLPPEISLSFISEIEIIKGAFSNNLKNLILGTGPATFILDYSQYRSPLLNQTIFWGTRFLRGHSVIFDWFLTKGILGIFGLLLLYAIALYYFFKNLQKENLFEIKLGIGLSFITLIYVSLFYPFNFVLWFSFFFILGVLVLLFSEKEAKILVNTSSKTMMMNFVLAISLFLSILLGAFNLRWYLAEVNFLKSLNLTDVNKSIEALENAVKLNPLMDNYWRNLSQLYLIQANAFSQDQKIPLEEKRNKINLTVARGAEAINRAISVEPMNVANWNVRGFFYQNLIGIEGAENLALQSYRRAIQLEPSSPFSFAEIGRVYILLAQNFSQKDEQKKNENLNLAIESLNKALQLKPDYPVANYLLAVALDQQGKLDEAIDKLEKAKISAPQDFGLRFQLGMLYWRKENLDKAKTQFEEALKINSDYSNAMYMLGLIYDKQGEKEKAKNEFEKVLKLNPENQEVKKILENLEKGLPALEGLTQKEVQVQLPPEIKK
jgi:tetratricopeptide (TPR) repeat protein